MITQFVFVGHHKERLLKSIRELRTLPVEKVVLFVGDKDLPGEDKVRKVAEDLKRELEVIWEVEIVEIDKKDVIRAVTQLIPAINREKREGREVVINASGSLRTLAIAGYIASCVTKSRIFTSIPKYNEKGEEIGIEEIIEIPILPIDFPSEEQMEIVEAINDGVNSLDELVFRLNPNIKKSSEEFQRERSRVSHHLSKLERLGLIKKVKFGRNVKIELTPLGRFLAGVRAP